MQDKKLNRFILFTATSMIAMLLGCILLVYLSIKKKDTECGKDSLKLSTEGVVTSINYSSELITINYRKSGLHKIDVYDKCGQNLIKSIEVKGD